MRFFLRALSLVVAGIDAYIMFRGEPRELWTVPGFDGSEPPVFAIPMLLIIILTPIWFGDTFSELEEQSGRWCPALLLKIVGWCALFVPIVIFVLKKLGMVTFF